MTRWGLFCSLLTVRLSKGLAIVPDLFQGPPTLGSSSLHPLQIPQLGRGEWVAVEGKGEGSCPPTCS